jgi:hypothetical protein
MQYMLLVTVDADARPGPGELDPAEWVAEHERLGIRVAGNRLQPDADTTTVRVRGERTLVTDGPFAESHEQIAGFDLIEAVDLDQAVEVAAAHPVARFGAIEVRAVWPF